MRRGRLANPEPVWGWRFPHGGAALNTRRRGFTLIEVVVALAVSATAAVVILAMVRSMYQHAEREQSLSREAIALGNDLVRMKMSDWREGSLQPDGEAAILLPSRDIGLPPLRVNNFSVRGETALPPVAAAHTPYQLFTFARDRYSVSFIGLALPSSTAPDAPIARPETTKSSGRP